MSIKKVLADEDRRLLVLWNQVEEDVYEHWKQEGPRTLEWDPTRTASEVGTVAEEMERFLTSLRESRFEVEVINIEDNLDRMMGAIRFYRPDAIFNLIEYFHDDPVQEDFVTKLGIASALGVLTAVLIANSLLIAVLAKLGHLDLISRTVVDGFLSGKHRSTHKGGCFEFAEHRAYTAGDIASGSVRLYRRLD